MSEPSRGPAYRVVTDRLVLRCWQPTDAPALKAAIDASLDHLRPWMPWAQQEPESIAEKVARLRKMRGQFDLGVDYVYGVLDRDERAVLGVDGVQRVEVHCDPDNVRSAAVPRRLGYVHEATLRRRMVRPDGTPRDTMIWTLLLGE